MEDVYIRGKSMWLKRKPSLIKRILRRLHTNGLGQRLRQNI